MTILITGFSTLLVTILAGVLLDFVRNARPRVVYSVKDAVFIELEGKHIGAYVVSLQNTSKRVVKDLECHLKSKSSVSVKLRDGGIAAPQGMKYSVDEVDDNLRVTIPYLNRDDALTITVIAESRFSPYRALSVAIRTPHDVKVVQKDLEAPPRGYNRVFLVAAAIATAASPLATYLLSGNNEPSDVLTFAAAASNLPHLAEIYATGSRTIHYYNQADLACALAASTDKRIEIDSYRRFLSLTLQLSSRMVSSSKANLYYCRGKLDLQVGDKASAIQDFKEAIDYNSSTVSQKAAVETTVRDFLAANSLR